MPSVKYYLNELKNMDQYTYEHSVRCGNALALFAEKLGMDEMTINSYREAGYMHDVGKLHCAKVVKSNVNLRELEKQAKTEKEKLNFKEFKRQFAFAIKTHVKYGMQVSKSIDGFNEDMLSAINYHHCSYIKNDNSYSGDSIEPIKKHNNLRKCPEGDAIPQIAQMLHVIDVYDALKYKRSYKQGKSPEEINNEMENNAEIGSFNASYYKIFKEQIKPILDQTPVQEQLKIKTVNPKIKTALNDFGFNKTTNRNSLHSAHTYRYPNQHTKLR